MPPSDPLTRTGTDLRESSPLLSPPVLADSHVDAQSYGDDEPGLTHFPPGSSLNPRNWPESRKWLIVAAITPTDLSVSWAASGFSPAEGKFAEEFGVSEEIARLGLSLYVLGIALGPMFLAPLSEVLGRNGICENSSSSGWLVWSFITNELHQTHAPTPRSSCSLLARR